MSRFLSRSEGLIAVSGDEDLTSEDSQQGDHSVSPAQSNRSLAFKDKAEILVPRLGKHQTTSFQRPAPPPKGILKQPNHLEVHMSEKLRKSKSAEMLGRSRGSGRGRKPQSKSLDRETERTVPGQTTSNRQASPFSASPSAAPSEKKIQFLEDKLKFSNFLDDVTTRVISPSRMQMLCGKPPEDPRPSSGNPSQRLERSHPQAPDMKKQGAGRMAEKSRPWDEWSQALARDRPSKKDKEGLPKTRQIPLNKDSSDQEPEKRRPGVHREASRPQADVPIYSHMGSGGDSSSKRSSDSDWEDESRRVARHQYQQRQLHQLATRARDGEAVDKPRAKYVPQPPQPERKHEPTVSQLSSFSILSQIKDTLSDADRIKILQQQNEDLRQRLSHTTHKMEAMETEFETSRHYMQGEMGRTRDDLEKMRDKFRRLQNSYTASQRANQDLEEKLHALAAVSQTWVYALRKVERDKKTMDQEIVELTNKLLDAKNTIDKLEELNERYRQDCNLAVQLLKCNKSHFRNHKFADLPYELQDMVNKHMKASLPDKSSQGAQGQDSDTLSLTPADVVPTSVIARVLEKPEPLVLNSAQSSSSAGRPQAEDVFVHVDMTGPPAEVGRGGRENGGPSHSGRALARSAPAHELLQQNGMCRSQSSLSADGQSGEEGRDGGGAFEKLNPYPAPLPPHPLYPGRKVIEFSSDDKVKIPKNSPLPNCTYATRQAISLSLVQNDEENERQRTVPNSPAASDGGWRSGASSSSGGAGQRDPCRTPTQPDTGDRTSSQSSPFSSPPQPPGASGSSGSSEEDLLANWQRMFVEKMAPASEGTLVNRTSFSSETVKDLERTRTGKPAGGGSDRGALRGAYSDGEEGSSTRSWTASRESSLDTDTSSMADLRTRRGQYGADFSTEESERLLMALDPLDNDQDDSRGVAAETANTAETSPAEAKRGEFADETGSVGSSAEERDILPQDFPVIAPRVLAGLEAHTEGTPPLSANSSTPGRPLKSPKRMGVHHLHRKDSLTRAQEHGNLLD
ncbi:tight junction-associated protein 1 isoform X1 [Esox lucius]|uniref:tight junction-associated protein 1 isoform X1 n=1 Tax=Esox lucius TaxID=8010 RepID=UPI0014768D0C|nr:tight junction-associated protein 1 isoform X1 [Esox lucius]